MMIDLHTHSVFSDGSFTPEQIIGSALKKGLTAVALCDHNTVAGITRFLAAAKGKPITAVAGTEISTDYAGQELHILGLFLPSDCAKEVDRITEEFHRQKAVSNSLLLERLNAAGYLVTDQEVAMKATGGYVNRAHVAAVLTQKGYTDSIEVAFDTLLSRSAGFYLPPARPEVFHTIQRLKQIGAAVVLAHPLLSIGKSELRTFIPLAKQAGLDGIEVFYPTYTDVQTAWVNEFADKNGLLKSGGSDFHGSIKPQLELGTGYGGLAVPDAFLLPLKNRSQS